MRLLLSMGLRPDGRVGAPRVPALRWLDTDSGAVEDVDVPLPEHPHPPGDAEFTVAHRVHDQLVQTTRTGVLWLSWPDLSVVRSWSHPLLADVHDALPLPDGTLAVTATGHDSVLRVSPEGEVVAHHHLRDTPFHEVFGHVTDFRTVPFGDLKPHVHHPNHLLWWRDALWVTCLHTQVCRCLTADHPPLRFPEGPPHDGRRRAGTLWFTTVNGHVVGVDAATGRRALHLDLGALTDSARMLGWCRGVEVVGDRLFVGMTQLRSTAHRELARWVLQGEAGRKLPTRVVEIHLPTRSIVGSWPVGNGAGGTIYSVTALTPAS